MNLTHRHMLDIPPIEFYKQPVSADSDELEQIAQTSKVPFMDRHWLDLQIRPQYPQAFGFDYRPLR